MRRLVDQNQGNDDQISDAKITELRQRLYDADTGVRFNIAHRVHNPLGYCQMLLQKLAKNSGLYSPDQISSILAAIEAQIKLAEDLRAFFENVVKPEVISVDERMKETNVQIKEILN